MKIKYTLMALTYALLSISYTQAEVIENYDVDIRINNDSTVDIREDILYDFEEESRHGIIRIIPYSYQNDIGHFNLKYENITVKDENGNEYPYEQSDDFSNYELKIGDADTLVSGKKEYVITYTAKRTITYFSDHDELYWNAIGSEWNVPIKKASISIEGENIENSDCYYGDYGSKNSCTFSKEGNILRTEVKDLAINQGITTAVGVKKGTIYEPTKEERTIEYLKDNWYFPIPFIVFFIFFYRWYKNGRDPEGKHVIVPNYEPLNGLSPLESKTAMEETVDITKLGAEIIQLAIKGYIKLEKIEKSGIFGEEGFKMIKTKEPDTDLNAFQSGLMKALFNGRGDVSTIEIKKMASEIGNEYSKNLRDFTTSKGPDSIYEKLTKEGYFPDNPNGVRVNNGLIGGLMIFPTFFIPLVMGFAIPALIGVPLFIGIMILALSMPKKTAKGIETKEYLEGLKKYIGVAEIERIKFHNAPEKTPEHFEELLPYAVIFGLEKEWAKKFESLNYQPNWYAGPNGTVFASAAIASDLSSAANSFSMATASSGASGLGGSGGVGGGGGGGGGGSW